MAKKKAKDRPAPRRRRRGGRARTQLFLGLLLFAPAAALVAGGDLTVDDAMLRFGGAGLFALLASGVLAAVVRPAPRRRAGTTPPTGPTAAVAPAE